MSEQEKIRHRVNGLRRRRRAQLTLDYFVRGLFWGAIPAALIIFASRLWILPLSEYWLAGGVLAAIALAFVVRSAFVRVTPLAVANDIDISLGLRERVSSALALGAPADDAAGRKVAKGSLPVAARLKRARAKAAPVTAAISATDANDPFVRALVQDAAKVIDKLPLRKVYPWRLPRAWRLALPALLIAALLSFVPQLNWFVSQSDRANAKLVQDKGHSLQELAKQIEEQAKKQNDPVLKKQAEEIKRVGEKLDKGQVTKKEALKQLQRLKEKLEAQSQPTEGEKQLMNKLGEELAKQTETRELGEKLKQGNFDELSQQLAELAKNLQSGKLSSDQMNQLQEMLKAVDEALKSDAANQPGAQDLKKNLEELKQAITNSQQAQQALQQAMQGFEKAMENLTQQLSQNGMSQQAQQLTQQLQQMQQQLQQNGTISQETLQQMQQSLQNTQQQIQNNQSLSQSQKQQLGQACQQAQNFLQSPQGQPGQLSQSNNQASQNQQQAAAQAQKAGDCAKGG